MITPVLPVYARAPLAFERGEGSWLIERSGRRYLDLAAGIAVCALGHAHPKLVKAVSEQAAKLWHVSNVYEIPGQEALARALVENSFADTVFFTNSGTEAIECAVKMARRYFYSLGQPEKSHIVAFQGAFHGRSSAGIAAAGGDKLSKGFGPLLPGFTQVPFGDLEAVKAAITPETAAIILETIQGEGGIKPLSVETLRAIRKLCDEHGLLLILDEIQCGLGRTGKLFAYEWAGIEPDVMTVAKALGGGFPVGACLATEKAASGMVVGTHGSTYGGNPLAMAVGLAVMEELVKPELLEHVRRVGARFRQGLEGLVASHPEVFEGVRGEGLMLGLVCRKPNLEVVKAAREAGALLVAGAENVARLLPPLTISEAEIDEALQRLHAAASALTAAAPAA